MGLGNKAIEMFIAGAKKALEMEKQDEKARKLMDKLDIPRVGRAVNIVDLYNVLMDEEKLKRIVSIMNNKAFW